MECPLCTSRHLSLHAEVEARAYFSCPGCGLVFLEPGLMPDLAAQKRHYDLHENDPQDAGYRMFLYRLMQPLLPRLRRGAYGLDFGCGPGPALAQMMNEHGFVMDVYDPIYANDEDVLEDTYDFITCSEVVEHLQRPGETFALFDRLLEPGGWLGVMTTWLEPETGFARWHYRRDPTHVCFFREDTFRWIATRFGWNLELPARNVALLRKPD